MIDAKEARAITTESGLGAAKQIAEITEACFASIEQEAKKGAFITSVCVQGCLPSSIKVALDGLKDLGFHCELTGKYTHSINICWLDNKQPSKTR